MKEEYLEIEELDSNAQQCNDQQLSGQSNENAFQMEIFPLQPLDFDGQHDDGMLRKLLKKFQMTFLYPILKDCDITYRSLRYLSVEDINTAIRSVGHRAEFREKLFSWRRKRYRTHDVIIEYDKLAPIAGNCTKVEQTAESAMQCSHNNNFVALDQTETTPSDAIQTPLVETQSETTEEMAENNIITNAIGPLKRDCEEQDLSSGGLPPDVNFEMESKRPKLHETTVDLRETRLGAQLNLVELLDESMFGPVMKKFYEKHGYLERKHRDELIHCIVNYVINHEIKLHSSDFNKIVDMIVNIFPTEEESRDYYFINRKGKRNPMGRLYTKYYNTLKRARVRDIHQEFSQETTLIPVAALQDEVTSASRRQLRAMMPSPNATSTSAVTIMGANKGNNINNSNSKNIILNNVEDNSNNSNSINTQIELAGSDFQEFMQLDDTSLNPIKSFLRCEDLDWNDIKTMWSKTYLARQEDIEHSTTKDVLQQWPKYLNAKGMELFDIDFRLKFSNNKTNALHEKWQTFAQKIVSYYQGNIRDDMCKGLFALYKSKPGKDTEDYITAVLLNAIMLPMARYRDALGNRRKISIVEAVDLFAIRVAALEDLDQKREEFSIKYGDIHSDHTPLIVVVGDSNINIHEIYVHFDVTLYEMPDFISALDCCMQIYRVLNLPYPSSNEYPWTFIQRYFYEIMLADDIKCPSMSSLITYLKF